MATGTNTAEDHAGSVSSWSESSNHPPMIDNTSPRLQSARASSTHERRSVSVSPSVSPSDSLRRVALVPKSRFGRAQAVLVIGPPGSEFDLFILEPWNITGS
jgi:hypothetical protein